MAVLPFGSWPSPVSATDVAAGSSGIDGARFAADSLWWGRSLPAEGGRVAVVRDGEVVLPAPWNARSGVHEYGGGAWTVTEDGVVLFVERGDQRVYALAPGAEPRPLTPAHGDVRHGGLVAVPGGVLAVREAHGDARVPRRDIVRIGLDGTTTSLVAGSDFLAQPALSPDGSRLAWVAWDHPAMPWDRTEVRVGRLVDGEVAEVTAIAGGASSALQPVWLSDDELLVTDDAEGRWNLRRVGLDGAVADISPADADTGGPLWNLGMRWFGATGDGRVLAVRTEGDDALVLVDQDGDADVPFPASARLQVTDARGSRALVTGLSARDGSALWELDLDTLDARLVAASGGAIEEEWMPVGRPITVDGPHGPVHAFDFPPTSPTTTGPDDELPPYVVFVHGGPTGHRESTAEARVAHLTSRGIGVLEVNYGGSSGYGRAYRERLLGQWGVVDVDDTAAAASGLAAEGRADAARLAISGSSAGGWTVLAALATTDVFAAGISRYGVGDARLLAEDTHDFEARYLDGLIGPLPEAAAVYAERSPLAHPEGFTVPVLLLQGADDRVVPPSQAEAIRDALAGRGVPHAYVLYEGEGHGFRRQETIVHALETELAFLGAVFGFTPDGVAPLELS